MIHKILIASDHGGYQLKRRLIRFFENELTVPVEDMGAFSYNKDDDYTDFVIPLGKRVAKEGGRGIVLCRNGIGVSIAVNKIQGIRCGIGYNIEAAVSMMTDDNTNILALAGDHLSDEHAMAIVKKWLATEFAGEERHVRRLKKIEELER